MRALPVKSILLFGFIVTLPLAVFAGLFSIIVSANFVTDIDAMRSTMQAATGMSKESSAAVLESVELPPNTPPPVALPPQLVAVRVTDKTALVRARNPGASIEYCRSWSLQDAPKVPWSSLSAAERDDFKKTSADMIAALQSAAAAYNEQLSIRDGEHPTMGQRSAEWRHWDPALQLESWIVVADTFEQRFDTGLPIVDLYLEHCQAGAAAAAS
jgi:hypothetical protein